MGKEIIAIAEALSNERAIPRDKIFEALETALATATKKKYPVDILVRVVIDKKDGSYDTFRRWEVVDTDGPLEKPAQEISLAAAAVDHPGIKAGDIVEEQIPSVEFDRITIQTAKQVLSQKVKDAEREQVVAEQRDRIGHVVNATVKKQTHDIMVLDLGNNAEAVLKREQIIPHETYGRGDRVKVLLQDIRSEPNRGPQIICSRTSPDFLKELFRIEVPEIGEDVIEIMGAARDPGSRAKIAVRSKDRRIDPRGACIGMRGARVMAVSNELSGEKIDVVLYDENLAQYVTNAMEPAEVSRIIINEDDHTILIAVAEENLALAIGRNGQNVRLASQLVGWKINVLTVEDMDKRESDKNNRLSSMFAEVLSVDEDFAQALVDAGFESVEEIAYVEPQEIINSIDGIDEELVEKLQSIAVESLQNICTPSKRKVADDLLNFPGLDSASVRALASKEVATLDELAECVTDDLVDIPGFDEKRAGDLIMAARNATWFKDEQAAEEPKAE